MAEKYENLIVENKGEICFVTFHRPGDRNSINQQLMDEVEAVLQDAENAKARAIIFTGGGDTYFIGGADGTVMMQCTPEEVSAFSLKLHDLLNKMEQSPLITVAAINGLCFGGGFEFALACDLRIASNKARVGLPEVRVGLIPGGGGTQRLPRLVGIGKAMDMILTGRGYKGEEALREGLVHQVVAPETLLADAEKYLRENLFRNPQYALVLAKRAVYASRNGSLAAGLKEENKQFKKCLEHDYFVKLMCKQIKEGILKTTTKLPDWVYK
jgi:enoyl-CoA hydratase/carnithine racemase